MKAHEESPLERAIAAAEIAAMEHAKAVERHRRDRAIPYPSASDPVELVKQGALVDVSLLTSRFAVTDDGSILGINEDVYLTKAAETIAAMNWAGVCGTLYGVHSRTVLDVSGHRRSFAPTDFMAPSTGLWLIYQCCPRKDGSVFVVIFARDNDSNPCWVPGE